MSHNTVCRLLVASIALLATAASCSARPTSASDSAPGVDASPFNETRRYYSGRLATFDILFVVDNSGGMDGPQEVLVRSFPTLVETLLHPIWGGNTDLHIGVVSTDLGAGSYDLPTCKVGGGDAGRLQSQPQRQGCQPPSDPWISYAKGKTNVPNCKGNPKQCLQDAFACIAPLGVMGCGFEMPLEAARRALDPKLRLNPGFLRPEAWLVVFFVSDEDDCSAKDLALFDPQQQGLSDPLGPLTSFRCFEFGVRCNVNGRQTLGERKGCVPDFDWLHRIESYERFYEQLKGSRHRVLMGAITGPPEPVIVGMDGANPRLEDSCVGRGSPAVRTMSLVNAFRGSFASICEPAKYGDLFDVFAPMITTGEGGACIDKPLLLANGGVACHAGVGPCKIPACAAGDCNEETGYCEVGGEPTGKLCGVTCLDKVEARVTQIENPDSPVEKRRDIPKCPRSWFVDPSKRADQCDDACPCWRIVPRPGRCTADLNITPFGLEIVARDAPAFGAAELSYQSADFSWNDPQVQNAEAHCRAP